MTDQNLAHAYDEAMERIVELEKALDALGVTVLEPGRLDVRIDTFLDAIGPEQRQRAAAYLHQKYGIAALSLKKVEGGPPVLPQVHRSSA